MALIKIEQDSPEVIAEVREIIARLGAETSKHSDAMGLHGESMYVLGWIAALARRGLLSHGVLTQLQQEQQAARTRPEGSDGPVPTPCA
ncbi:hypothetical protein V0R55_24770 [Pseudomonas soli]|uniref:Uncharacterized protein n=1 Tax=Pseudomonas soli TaxID=1306993 RepID=A0ABU7GX01_9PSED|nr:hypothetical protein [Pseudomonas soli]MEE1883382.1 hypothetical protein [Pseudomonas soli]